MKERSAVCHGGGSRRRNPYRGASVRFLLNQDVYALTARFLRALEYDVVTAADECWQRTLDHGSRRATMPTVTLEEAQAKLRDLIHNLLQGEELVITETDCPIATLTRSPRTWSGR